MDILKQRDWTDAELYKAGFRRYDRKKFVVLARVLPASDAPKRIKTAWDTLVALAGYMICYDVDNGKPRATLDDYKHWPVEPRIFLKSFRKWDKKVPWQPNAAEKQLMELGCKPYYKFTGVWAKRLKQPLWVESLESVEPILIPVGGWIAIGIEGEPYTMSQTEFRRRYQRAAATKTRKNPTKRNSNKSPVIT